MTESKLINDECSAGMNADVVVATPRDCTGSTSGCGRWAGTPPRLFAIKTWPGVAGTTGGPRHDERARVLRPDGRPVPRLYAAGAVSLVWGT